MKKRSLLIIMALLVVLLSLVFEAGNLFAASNYDNVFEIKGNDGSWKQGTVKLTVKYLGHDHFRDTKNKKYSYSIGGGSYNSGSSVTITKQGVTKVKFKLTGEYQVNFMGGWNSFVSYEETTVRIDNSAPVVKFTGGVFDQWVNNDQVAVASASDPESGIAYFESNGRKTITNEGNNTVSFSARNNAGFTSSCKGYILIDKTVPSIQIKNLVSDGTWANKPVTVSATAGDSLSGINENSWKYNTGDDWKNGKEVTLSNEGTINVKFRVADKAGNLIEKSTKLHIDKTAPSMTIDNPITTWVNIDSVTVSASAKDELCGINTNSWQYNTGESWKDGSKVTINNEGTTNVKFRVADNAGNLTEKSTKVYIDRTKPVISINPIPDWSRQVSVTGHVYDQVHLSGLDLSTFRYRIDQEEWESWTFDQEAEDRFSFKIPVYMEGIPVLDFKVSDKVGNQFETSTKVYIDLTEPVIHDIKLTEFEFDGKVIEEGEYSSTKSVCASVYATDCFSVSVLNPKDGNISYGYQVTNAQNSYDKSNYKSITSTQFEVKDLADGNNYLYLMIVDTAGNKTEKRISILVDSAVPTPPYIECFTHPYAYTVRDAVKGKNAVFELTHGIAGRSGFGNFIYCLEKGNEVLIDNKETESKRVEIYDLADNAQDEFYRLKVWSVSGSGRKGDEYSLYAFRIDSSPPRYLTITSPTHVSESVYYADSQALLEWDRPFDFTGIKSYYYKLRKEPISENEKEGWTAADVQNIAVDLKEVAGNNLKTAQVYAAVWAEDYAGNIQFDSRKFMYDTVRPELGKIEDEYVIVDKDPERGQMTFRWGEPTDDIGISRIFLKLAPYGKEDEEDFIMAGKEAGSYTWEVLADSEYIFTMKVFDTSGNCKMYSKAVALNYEITRDIGIPFSTVLGGYTVEGNTYLDTSNNTAQLLVPYGMDLIVDNEVPRGIELVNTEFDGDTLVYGQSGISYVFKNKDYSFTGKGITISEDEGLLLDEVTYKLPGIDNEITLFNVRISGAPSFVVLKSDIAKLPEFFYSEPQNSNPYNIGFAVKDGVSLENGNILFYNAVMDSTHINCKTMKGEIYENKLYFSTVIATSKGLVKSGAFDQTFVLEMKGNSYEVDKENALLNFEGIVVKEMEFSGSALLNLTLNYILIPMEGTPVSLDGFGFAQNTFGPDDFKLTVNDIKITDGYLIIGAKLDTGNGISYSINNMEFTGGVLDKKEIEEQSYASVEFAEDFYSNLSKASLKLSEFNADLKEEKVKGRANVEQIKGLTIWEYGILSGDLSITKYKGENSKFEFEGSIKLTGEIPEAIRDTIIPVESCTFGEKAEIRQLKASVSLDAGTMFSGSVSITDGVINVAYDENAGPEISCNGSLYFPWMLETVLGDTGLPINSLYMGSEGKIDEFIASRRLADGTSYKNGSMFNNSSVVGALDENGYMIFKMSGDMSFTEDFPGGIADTGIYIEEMIFNDRGIIESIESEPRRLFDAGFIPGSQMELSDIVIEANKDGTGINYVVSGQLRLAEIKDIKGLTRFDGMVFDVERLAISDEGYIADIRAGGSIDGTINFIGNTVIEDPSVYIIDALSEYEQFNTRIGGKIIIPVESGEDINSIPPLELNIDRMLLDQEGNPYILDASVESSGIRPFIGKSYLKDPKISLSYSEGEILTSFQGKVILMGIINEESDLELGINNLVVNQNGEIVALDVSGTIPDDVKTAGDFLLREGKIRFVKEGSQTPIIEISGKILLPEMEMESFSRMEINLIRLRFDLKGNLLAISAQQKINPGFKLFDDVKLKEGTVGIEKNSPEAPIIISVSGAMVLPESAPGALSGSEVALRVLSFNQNGKILDFGASLDLGPQEKDFIGSSKIRNGFLGIGKPEGGKAAEIGIKGTIILPENAPGAVAGAEVTINKFIMGTDLSIKELDITALEFFEERRLVGGLNSKNIKMSIIKGGGSQLKVKLEGDIILKEGFPEGLKNKVFAINEFTVDSSGKIEKLSIDVKELDVSLYDLIDIRNGSIVIENGTSWNELLFKVGGDLILPEGMPGDLSGRSVHIKSFVISTKDGVVEFKADPLGSVTFNLWGGVKAVVDGLEINKNSVFCKGYLQFPSNYPEGVKNLKVNINRLELGYNGSIKDIDADVDHIQMKLAGFTTDGWNMRISGNGAKFSRCEIQMPPNLGSKKIKIIDAGFDTKGNFTGRFENPDLVFDIAGCRLTLKSAQLNFNKNEITFSQAILKMASELGGQTVTLNGVKLSPNGISFTGGSFKLPSFNISGGVGFKGAKVSFKTEDSKFILQGTSGIMIKNLGTFNGTINITDKSSQYPVGIKSADFEYTIGGLGVPIGSTGLYLNKIRGGIAFGYPSEVPSQIRGMFSGKMRIQMGVSMQDQTYGNLVKGNCDMWIAVEDCTMAFKGDVTVLNGLAKGEMITAISKKGFYGMVKTQMLFARGTIEIYVFDHRGKTCVSGSGKLDIGIKKGALYNKKIGVGSFSKRIKVPDKDVWVGSAGADFGLFKNGKKGVRAYVSFPIVGKVGVFVSGSDIKIGGVGGYNLYKPSWAKAYDRGYARIFAFAGNDDYGFLLPKSNVYTYNFVVPSKGSKGVQSDAERVVFCLAGIEDPNSIVLISPEGKRYGISSPNVVASFEEWGILAALVEPETGEWSIEISGFESEDEFDIEVFGVSRVPEVSLSRVEYRNEKKESLIVAGATANVEKGAEVDIYLSESSDVYYGNSAALGEVDADGNFTGEVDLKLFDNGEYHVFAVVKGQEDNPDVHVVYDEILEINLASVKLKPVVNFIAAENHGGDVGIIFEDINGERTHGFNVYVENTITGEKEVFDLGYITDTYIPGYEDGDVLNITVAPYDLNMVEGERSLLVTVRVGGIKGSINVFTLEKDEIQVQAVRGEVVQKEIKLINLIPVKTGTALDYADISVVQAVYDSRGESVIDSVYGIKVDFESRYDITKGEPSINFNVFAQEDIAPGEYTLKAALENIGNRDIRQEMTIRVMVIRPDLKVSDVYPEGIDLGEDTTFEIIGSNFTGDTKVFLEDSELTIVERYEDMIVAEIPQNTGYGIKKLKITADNKQVFAKEVEILEPFYTLSCDRKELYTTPGSTAQTGLFIKGENGFNKGVKISVEDLPEAWEASFDKQTALPGEIAILTLKIPQGFGQGDYRIKATTDESHEISLLVHVREESIHPLITGCSKNWGEPGETIKIFGGFFDENSEVLMGDSEVSVLSVTKDTIEILIGDKTRSGEVQVQCGDLICRGPVFNVVYPLNLIVIQGEPDGYEGYYITRPDMEIESQGQGELLYRINGGDYVTYDGRFSVEEGVNKIEANAYDETGIKVYSREWIVSFDKTPPHSSIKEDRVRVDIEKGIHINSSDNVSGIRETKYRIKGGNTEWTNWKTYENQIITEHKGWNTMEYYSIDNAGNTEAVKTVKLNVSSWKDKNHNNTNGNITELEGETPAIVPVDLAVSISADKSTYIKGQTITYTIKYKNILNMPTGEFVVIADIPEYTSIEDNGGGEVKDEKILWKISGLEKKAEGHIVYKVLVNEFTGAENLISNTAVLESKGVLISAEDDRSSITVMLRSDDNGKVIHKAYIKGYQDRTFRADSEVTRAEIAAIFAKLLELEGKEEGEITYRDLKPDHWAAGSIYAVTKSGIFKGYEDNMFMPDSAISRAELSMVIARYLKLEDVKPFEIHYSDIEGHWALNFVEEINRYNIIKGYEDGTFRPDENVKRSEAVTLINKMLYRGPLSADKGLFTDVNSSHWAFGQIEEAALEHELKLDDNGNEILQIDVAKSADEE